MWNCQKPIDKFDWKILNGRVGSIIDKFDCKMFKYSGFDSYDSYVKKSKDVSAYEGKKEAARQTRYDFSAFEEVTGLLLSSVKCSILNMVVEADRPNMPQLNYKRPLPRTSREIIRENG